MVKKLVGCIGEYKKETIQTPIFVGVECAFEVLIPLIMARLIDSGVEKGRMDIIIIYGLVLLAASMVSLAGGVTAGKTAAVAAAGFAANLRKKMFYNVQTFAFSNIDKFSAGSIVTRLTTDITNVTMAFQMIIRGAVRSPLMLVFSLAAAFSIHKGLSLIFLAMVPIMAVGLAIIMKTTFPVFDRMFKVYDKMNNRTQENLHGIRVVKAFVREKHETEEFRGISGEIYDLSSKAERILAFNMPIVQVCLYGSLLLISWFGAHVIVASGGDAALGLSTGELMSLLTYVMQILISLMMLSMIFVMVTMAKSSGERIGEILDEKTDLKNPENPILTVPSGAVEFDNVSFSYYGEGGRKVLKNVNLKIASGESIGIIGGTGSSKSTLVQLIPRLYDVTEGSVKVGGVDVREYDMKVLREQVSMVLQKNTLFGGTVASNLRWGDEKATDEELKRVCRLACADEFVEKMEGGINAVIEQGGTNVSGGQKQRLTIARALLKKPKILILDDSTSAVDTHTDAEIRKALKGELPETTKIIIAQRISSVKDLDRILVINDGTVVAFDTHDALMASCDIYKEIYESQMRGGLGDE